MYIRRVELTNVRAFSHLTIPSDEPLPMRTLIIGGNSTCKTSLLRCIAIGLCNETHASALLSELPGSLVGPRAHKATIKLTLYNNPHENLVVTTVLQRRQPNRRRYHALGGRLIKLAAEDEVTSQVTDPPARPDSALDHSDLFVCGYGAGRGQSGTESWTRYRIIDSVYTLFRYDQPLQNPELILYRLHKFYPRIASKTVGRLLKLLGLSPAHKFELTASGVMVKGPRFGRSIPLDAVADGYRTTFTWLADLVGWAMQSGSINQSTGQIEGVALIDELEQHLHPTIQISLLRRIRKVFPGLQIIATSHSPVTALYAEPGGLYALKRVNGRIQLLPSVKDVSYLTFEDVLNDERLFDAEADGPSLSRSLREYRRLARTPAGRRSAAIKKKLALLAEQIADARTDIPLRSATLDSLKRLRRDLGL